MVDEANKLASITFLTESAESLKEPPDEPLASKSSTAQQRPKNASTKVKNGFEVLDKNDIEQKNSSVQESKESDIVKVDIGNGVMANMKIEDLEKVTQI